MLPGRKTSQRSVKTALTVASFVLAVFASLAVVHAVRAQGISANEVLPDQVGQVIGTGTQDIRITIARIVRVALGLLGTVALLIILYAGFIWMTAAGDAEKVDRAKRILTSAAIGLAIILSAFAITSFIISRLLGEGGGAGGAGGGSSAPSDIACIGLSATCPAGALGNGIIESHYPGRNATGVPRNTRVVVTFKKKIDPASIIVGGANATVAILKSSQVVGTSNQFPQKFAQSLTAADIDVAATPDGLTFVFVQKNCPTNCFGSPSENVFYTVALRGGSSGIKLSGGADAFTGTFNSGYLWEFQVSTLLDTTPPTVSYLIPTDGETGVPRNSLIQVDFDEPVDPVSVASGLSITQTGGTVVQGVQQIGNQYQTVEFRTNQACGTNSCGETVYCLPGNQTIGVRVKTDALTSTPPLGIYPPSGVTDMAGNALDGNGNGTAEGGPTDDHVSSFQTNNTIDLVPPKVVSQSPATLQGSIARDLKLAVTFSKLMSSTSFTTDNAKLIPGTGGAPTNYSIATEAVSSTVGGAPDETTGLIDHDLLSINQPYSIDMTSGLRDLHQNCFYPGGGQTVCTGSEPYCCNGVPSQAACGFLP